MQHLSSSSRVLQETLYQQKASLLKCVPSRQDKTKQICAFSPLIFFFYFSGFIVFDSVSRGGLLSSGGSAVRVVGDRSQFCFSALGRQSGSITLNMVLSAETPLTAGVPLLTSHGRQRRHVAAHPHALKHALPLSRNINMNAAIEFKRQREEDGTLVGGCSHTCRALCVFQLHIR